MHYIVSLAIFRYTFAVKNLIDIVLKEGRSGNYAWTEMAGWTLLILGSFVFGLLSTAMGTLVVWVLGLLGILLMQRDFGKTISGKDLLDNRQGVTKNELVYQKHYLESLVESSSIAIVTLDMQQRIQRCNQAFEKIFGYSSEEAIGKNLDELIVPDEKKTQAQELTSISFRRESIHRELVRRRKDGTLVDVELHAKSIDMDEKQVGVIAQYVDISERKRAEESLRESENKYRKIFENIQDVFYVTDMDGLLIDISPSIEGYSGYRREELIGYPVQNGYYYPQDRIGLLKAMRGKGEVVDYEIRLKTKNQKLVYASVNAHVLYDANGKAIGIERSMRDVTERRRAEESVQLERNILRTLIDNLPDLIYFKDMQGRYVLNNAAHLRSLGMRQQDDVLGKTTFDFNPKELAAQYHADEMEIIRTGTPLLGKEERALHKDTNEHRWHSTSKIPLIDVHGKVTGIVGISRDITDQKIAEDKLRSSEALFRSIWEYSSDGMRLTDQHGIILNVNLSFCAMMGVSREEIIGKAMSDVYDPSIRSNVMKRLAERLSGDYIEARMERELLLHNGRTISVEVSNSVIARENGESAVLSIFRDVTERKKTEGKIKEQINVIENQNIELAKARDLAMEASKTKSAFLANMSHELRTPLNAIIGYSEMLIEEMSDTGKTGYEDDLEKIQMAGKNLLGLINEVLDLSKIESGKMELYLEEFDLKSLADEVVATVQPLVTKNENSLVLKMSDKLPIVRLDVTKIRQILFNLISNASKFTDHGTITLTGDVIPGGEASASKIILKVSDTGIGLTEEQKMKLFKEFSQADSATTRKYGGTGLGLAISKRFCEMMNGTIDVESTPNKGTTFTLVIPQRIEYPSGKVADKTDTQRDGKRISANTAVLVIDDDPSVRDLLQRYLSKERYVVECVSSGDEGLARAKELIPMAIILDVMMPHKDGWAVLQEIKSDPLLKSVPVVMYTMVDEKNFGLAIGATEYLIKPVSREKILQVLDKVKRETTRKYVLLVDDDPDFRDIASRALEKEGWRVRTAENGISALAFVENELPSIIFLDLMMPMMDGFEFLTIVQSRKEWEHLPIVIVTSKDLSADERLRLEGAAKKVIQKGDLTAEKLLKQLALLIPNLAHSTPG